MSLLSKGLVGGLLLLLATNLLYRFVLYDLAMVNWHPATKENSAGKRVLITGSSRGIGEALALLYCELGAQVTLHSRYSSSLVQVAEKCRGRGSPGVHSVVGDMSVPEAAAEVVRGAAEAMGGLDIVVVNHADSAPFEFLSRSFKSVATSPERLQSGLRVNLLSYIEASLTALPYLEASNGSLVLVSSIITRMPMPYCFEYCFSKRSMEGFLGSLRQELAMNKSKVHAGIAVVGVVDTQLAKKVMANAANAEELISMQLTPPDVVARDIASMPVARIRELVTPWTLRLPTFVGSWAPELMEPQLRWNVS